MHGGRCANMHWVRSNQWTRRYWDYCLQAMGGRGVRRVWCTAAADPLTAQGASRHLGLPSEIARATRPAGATASTNEFSCMLPDRPCVLLGATARKRKAGMARGGGNASHGHAKRPTRGPLRCLYMAMAMGDPHFAGSFNSPHAQYGMQAPLPLQLNYRLCSYAY